ncbi:MAG: GAF domain-containing protein, partial [Chloroflexi bacterium]|nr:GAF domain-containing protein [Chloroflexota bacterium]
MNPLNTLGILLIVGAIFVLSITVISARLVSRQQQLRDSDDSPIPVNLASINDAVVAARIGGQVTFINDVAIDWFDTQTSTPDLWLLSSKVEPPEAFLELFAAEGRALFTVGSRPVEASSHRVAMGEQAQFVVVMQEEVPLPTLDRTERGSAKALQVLSEIGQSINAPLELDATLAAALDGVSRLVPYDAAQITLWDQETETLTPVQRAGPATYVEAGKPSTSRYRLGEGYPGWIAQRRRALMVENVREETEIDRAARETDPAAGCYMGVPLMVRNRFIGTLEVLTENAYHYDREDLAVLTLIAEQAAIAIENARRYSTQAERVAELSGLQKIAEAISDLQDPYQLFSQLGQRIADLMNTEIAGVMLWDREQARLVAQRPVYGVADSVIHGISLEM